ncbi:hypothetical protein HNY73_017925 [Argiope bruennichi]|uniref:Platelet-derived growth factor (PDGF) family profile domain-containing protein n=1 Tax=Argiope bruennichi TaxID=94029 RepID=A0A8T0EEH5_ARGBR|nr:hypothetical protein HNY73_017925 [Argiope bruennichi]
MYSSSVYTMSFKIFCICIYACLIVLVEPKPKLDYKTKSALANAHVDSVMRRVMCSVPQPRVVQLQTEDLRVMPHATIIHRCDESTGCCDSLEERCVAKKKEQVTLYAFVAPRRARKQRKMGKRIKKFVFTNHTECYCENIMDTPK